MDRSALKALKRQELQRLCKQYRLRGNLKTTELVDLLATHFEQQNRMSQRITASPSPGPSTQSQDENRQPSARHTSLVLADANATPEKFPLAMAADLADIDLNQLAQPNQPLSSRISALESLCTRLISNATASATTVAALQGRLDAAELSITTLNVTLEDTRSQLSAAQSQLRILRSSIAASDQLATESNTALSSGVAFVRHMAESVGNRLSQAEEKWQADLTEMARHVMESEDKMLFEPPTFPRAPSLSRRSKSREASGSTISWAQNQQAIAGGGLGIPAVRLFGAGAGPSTFPDDMEVDEERPGTSSSSTKHMLAPSLLPHESSRTAAPVPRSSSMSSVTSFPGRKAGSVDPYAAESSRPVPPPSTTAASRESSRAAGKRPASPIPIPGNPRVESDTARATKRARHAGSGSRGDTKTDESPSLNSFSAGASISTADSPLFPPSPGAEPSTPPSKRPPALLPPVEIISTPSPSNRSQMTRAMSLRKDYGDPHGFATNPRPPVEGPSSPTIDSPRRGLARRFKVDPGPDCSPPILTFAEMDVTDSGRKQEKAKQRARSSLEPTPSLLKSSLALPSSPAPLMIGKGKVVRASVDPETASAVRATSRCNSEEVDGNGDVTMQAGPSTTRALDHAGPSEQPPPPPPARQKTRPNSFFAPRLEFPTTGSYVNSSLAPPPPPPLNYMVSRRLGSAPLLTSAPPPPAEPARDYSADPGERRGAGGGPSHRLSLWPSNTAEWTRAWGR